MSQRLTYYQFNRFNEFGVDGGPAAKALRPKFDAFTNHVSHNLGVQVPEVEVSNALQSYLLIYLCVSMVFH